jgi:4-diphosphocytidyl-2-C-methyl-D-erythritol kinase
VRLRCLAPGKVNLCLFVGRPRTDGLHPLVSIVQPVSLADELTLEPAPPGAEADEVVCPGVEGPNLAGRALAAFRAATGWDAPPQRLTIRKRVPVAAGMGGGSGDAAGALRLAAHAAGGAPRELLLELAAALGGDVPSQVEPGRTLMTGAGERVRRLPEEGALALAILPSPHALSTPDVYRAFDALGAARGEDELARLEARPDALPAHNDLQDAARRLCPAIDDALAAVAATGAEHALVSGSGPTVFGLFGTVARARAAAQAVGGVAAEPVGPAFAAVRAVRHNGAGNP